MKTIAIIPARGGSKGVPGKNLRLVGGIPLVGRAVRACIDAALIDEVYVSTDDPAIAAAGRQAGAEWIHRPADLAGDHASSETALLHGLDHLSARGDPADVLVFVQCTSPFIQADDLDAAVRMILDDRADTVFSGVETFEFLWRDTDETTSPGEGHVTGQNHDSAVRPLRQQRRPDFRETGAFYAMRTDGLRTHKHRFFGRISVVGVAELTSLEIDTFQELALADAVAKVVDHHPAGPIDVDAVITDFDGVHTPDTAYLDENGRESVRVSRSDGMGVTRVRAAQVPFLILSKERNPVVTARAAKLGVDVLQGIDDKATALQNWLNDHGIDPARAAYVGNDVNDLGPMGVVGWPVAVPDAHPQVLAAARVVLTQPAGGGAVREVCERVLSAVDARSEISGSGRRPGPEIATNGEAPMQHLAAGSRPTLASLAAPDLAAELAQIPSR